MWVLTFAIFHYICIYLILLRSNFSSVFHLRTKDRRKIIVTHVSILNYGSHSCSSASPLSGPYVVIFFFFFSPIIFGANKSFINNVVSDLRLLLTNTQRVINPFYCHVKRCWERQQNYSGDIQGNGRKFLPKKEKKAEILVQVTIAFMLLRFPPFPFIPETK